MKLIYLKEVNSTQIYIKELIRNTNQTNICIYTFNQTQGLGSQNNKWEGEEGNLFFSFVIPIKDLPDDLKLQSASIYLAYILKEYLVTLGSKVVLKWPNDFYIEENKIGGLITNKSGENLICGIGLNIKKTSSFEGHLDININKVDLLEQYFKHLKVYPSWKQIFSKYKLEFHSNKNYFTNINNKKLLLKDQTLNNDGSLNINGKKVYSLR